jgi:hypothetical protein
MITVGQRYGQICVSSFIKVCKSDGVVQEHTHHLGHSITYCESRISSRPLSLTGRARKLHSSLSRHRVPRSSRSIREKCLRRQLYLR